MQSNYQEFGLLFEHAAASICAQALLLVNLSSALLNKSIKTRDIAIDLARMADRQWRLVLMTGCVILLSACTSIPENSSQARAPSGTPQTQSPTLQQQNVTVQPTEVEEPKLGVTVAQPELLIANDLIEVLRQVDGFQPNNASLKMPNPANSFASALENALLANGYRLRRAKTRAGQGVILSSVIPEQSTTGDPLFTYYLAVDRLALKRSYIVRGNYVEPTSSLFVRGAPAQTLELNDTKFQSGF